MKTRGKVYLVGAGPGDPELISLKAVKRLREADTVIYDRLINPELLKYAPRKAQTIYAGKSPRKHTLSQDKINSLLVEKARAGKTVVRLKCGDPFLFGRGAEEALFLNRHKIPFEIIPGISSALAVAAYAGIPLTHRDYTSSIGIFTGHEEKNKPDSAIPWPKISTGIGTLVFLMGVENLSLITKNLISNGRPKSTPCCLIQNGTTPGQKTVTADLGTITLKAKQAGILPPAILVAGDVVNLRKQLNWFEGRPLFGKNIMLTRPTEEKNRLREILEEYGARCDELAAIAIKPLASYRELDTAIKNIRDFNWLIFSSQNAVRFFNKRLARLKTPRGALEDVKIAAIGPNTKMALENTGLRVALEPKEFCQEGLLEAFKKTGVKNKNILIVRCLQARNLLAQGLKEMGARVQIAPAYQTIKNQKSPAKAGSRRISDNRREKIKNQKLDDVDVITFTSALAAKSFFETLSRKTARRVLLKKIIASIGPVTSREIKKHGFKPAIEAKKYTFEGLAEAIIKYYVNSKVKSKK